MKQVAEAITSILGHLPQTENIPSAAMTVASPEADAPATGNLAVATVAPPEPASLVERPAEDTARVSEAVDNYSATAAAATAPTVAVGVMPGGGGGGGDGVLPTPTVPRTSAAPEGTRRVRRLPPGLFFVGSPTAAPAAAVAPVYPDSTAAAVAGVMPGGGGGCGDDGVLPTPTVPRASAAPEGTRRVRRLPPGLFFVGSPTAASAAAAAPVYPDSTAAAVAGVMPGGCLLYTSPSPRDLSTSRMPSSA